MAEKTEACRDDQQASQQQHQGRRACVISECVRQADDVGDTVQTASSASLTGLYRPTSPPWRPPLPASPSSRPISGSGTPGALLEPWKQGLLEALSPRTGPETPWPPLPAPCCRAVPPELCQQSTGHLKTPADPRSAGSLFSPPCLTPSTGLSLPAPFSSQALQKCGWLFS